MSIQERLLADMKEAMRNKDKLRLTAIRSARDALQKAQLEAVKQHYDTSAKDVGSSAEETSGTITETLDDATQEKVIAREVKRRRESAEMYRNGGRIDLAEQEEAEAQVLEDYLPQQLSAEELRPQIAAVINELQLSGTAAMGTLMPVLMERFKGQADGKVLSQLARELLQGN
jgi:hypothetical protein